jgi:ABC transporter fused permease/ATP-binding protein
MARERASDRIPEEKRKLNRENLKKIYGIFKFMLPYRWYFFLGLLTLFLSSALVMSFPFITGKLVDAATGQSDWVLEDIDEIALSLIAILLIQSVFSYARVYLFAQVSERSMADIRKGLFSKLLSLPFAFFDRKRIGELFSRITNDVAFLKEALSLTLAEFFRQIATFLIGMSIILWESTQLTLVMVSVFPLIVIGALIFGRYIRRLSRSTQDQLANTNVVVEESLQAINVVKSYTNEDYEYRRYSNALEKVVGFALRTAKYRGAFFSFVVFGLFGAIVLVLWYGAGLVAAGEMTIGALTSFIIYTMFIGASVGGLGDLYGQLQKAIGSSERILEILDEPSEESNGSDKKEILKIRGEIEFKNVHFSYPSREQVEVLKDISINLQPGKRVALVGHSGAGKSTIIQLLLRFYHPNQGQIIVDGKDYLDFDLKAYRDHIGLVPQEIILFGGTIRENIAYGKPGASDEEIKDAAEKAQAWEFIKGFPEEWETVVGDRGIKLSGGQRQRVAIARAILRDPRILILDEATSSLDAASEHLVQLALDNLMQGRTTLIIAHRLGTIRKADQILVLKHGEIVEAGRHEELTSNVEGVYSNLIRMQTEGMIS